MPEHIDQESAVPLRRPLVVAAIAVAAIPILTLIGGLTLTGWSIAGPVDTVVHQSIVAEH